MSKEFEKWFEYFNEINSGEEDKDTAEIAWNASKRKVLEILDKYRHVPGINYVKEEVERL